MHKLLNWKQVLYSFCFVFVLSLAHTSFCLAQPTLPADLKGENVPFLPYLEYCLDEKGLLDIETVSLQEKSLQFLPFHPLDINTKTGVYWLRFTIGPLSEGAKAVEWLLALGESLPGDPELFVPEIQNLTGMQQWRVSTVTDRHILTLPEAGSDAKTCYIRLAGPPGLWFNPTLRSPHNAANNWGALAHPAAVLALCVILLLCLVRSFSEHGQWRIWTVFFVAGALASGYLGLPSVEKGHIGFTQFACVLAPGIALMLLPHIARHMMQSATLSRIIDAQLILLTLVGACVTLIPLVPGCAWLARFLELWPLCTVFFIPTALWAFFSGLPSSQRFLLVCLLPPIFTAAGILGLLSGFPSDIAESLPLLGIALSALFLVAAPNPKRSKKKDAIEEKTIVLQDLEDPNLRIVSLEPDMPREESKVQDNTLKPQQAPHRQNELLLQTSIIESLQEPMDALFNEAKQLEGCALPPAVRSHAFNMVDQARRLVDILHGTANNTIEEDQKETRFDLQIMMRDIYNRAVQAAQNPEIALGWYMPPELPSIYAGSTRQLRSALQMLVESSVRATEHGSVHFTVQSYPESDDPGHLLFAITDTGKGMPPKNRSGVALTRAWEVVGACQGSLSLESSQSGTTVYFSVHLTPQQLENEEKVEVNAKPLILICSEQKEMREHLPSLIHD
ncbi:MAG: response regulator, partial [Desulfovibrio sp.]|nr:response regulator [Desulfovibrio sp.]